MGKPAFAEIPDNLKVDLSKIIAPCSGDLKIELYYRNNSDKDVLYKDVLYPKDSWVLIGGKVKVTVEEVGKPGNIQHKETWGGKITFENLPCNRTYRITAEHLAATPALQILLDGARKYIGSERWAYGTEVTSLDRKLSLPEKTNKCSFFIYDMIQQNFGSAPTYTYQHKLLGRDVWGLAGTNTVPALADFWTKEDNRDKRDARFSGDPTPGWMSVDFRQGGYAVCLGSILAIAVNYSDATGHVGIIDQPETTVETLELGPGLTTHRLLMQGKTISADSKSVVNNNWGFRSSSEPDHHCINSPRAGVETIIVEPVKREIP